MKLNETIATNGSMIRIFLDSPLSIELASPFLNIYNNTSKSPPLSKMASTANGSPSPTSTSERGKKIGIVPTIASTNRWERIARDMINPLCLKIRVSSNINGPIITREWV